MALTTSHPIPLKRSSGVRLPLPFPILLDALGAYARRALSFLLILGIPVSLLLILFFGVFGMADVEASRITPGILFSPAVFFLVVLSSVFVLFLQIWGGIALLYAVMSPKPEPFWVSYARSFSKIGSYLWILILFYFVGLAGSTFFVLPGIYFLVSILFALFVFFDEGVKGTAALQRSFSYVRGNWWGVCFHIAFVIFLGAAFFILCRFLLSAFLPLFSVKIIMNFISWLFLYPFGLLYLFHLFTAIRTRKPWVREEFIHNHFFALVAFAGFVIFAVTPFLTLRGASKFFPTFYPDALDFQKLFNLGLTGQTTSVRSGPRGEQLLALQMSRDEKRLLDMSSFTLVFDSIASRHSSFCEGFEGDVFKSTTPSGGGTNWLPIDLAREGIEGSLVTHTPRDPVNTSRYYYSFACSNGGTYEVSVRLESTKNVSRGFSDGGNNEELFEAGSNLSLIP